MDYFLATPFAQGFLLAAEQRGVPRNVVLEAARIDPALLGPDALVVRWPVLQRLLREVLRLTGDPALGMLAAELTPWGSLRVPGHFIFNHATLRDQFNATFQLMEPLWINMFRKGVVEARGTATDLVQVAVTRSEEIYTLVEFSLSFAVLAARVQGIQGWVPRQLYLERPVPADPRPWEAWFGCPVQFGQERNAMEFDSAMLDAAPSRADPTLLPLIRPHLTQHWNARMSGRGTMLWLQETVVSLFGSGERITLSGITEHMQLRPRTLQHKLLAEGVGFKEVIDSVRKETACTQLASTGISQDALAAYLGFSDPATLVRAFQRWMGMTPSQWRNQMSGIREQAAEAMPQMAD